MSIGLCREVGDCGEYIHQLIARWAAEVRIAPAQVGPLITQDMA